METLEDGIHCGRLWVVCDEDRIDYLVESIIWSIFTVKVIDYRCRFLLSL